MTSPSRLKSLELALAKLIDSAQSLITHISLEPLTEMDESRAKTIATRLHVLSLNADEATKTLHRTSH
jgi:hypothetical protein